MVTSKFYHIPATSNSFLWCLEVIHIGEVISGLGSGKQGLLLGCNILLIVPIHFNGDQKCLLNEEVMLETRYGETMSHAWVCHIFDTFDPLEGSLEVTCIGEALSINTWI